MIITIEKLSGSVVSGPEIISRGFIFEDASQDVLTDVKELVYLTLSAMPPELIADKALVQAKVRSVLKKYLRNTMERKPMIMPLFFEV